MYFLKFLEAGKCEIKVRQGRLLVKCRLVWLLTLTPSSREGERLLLLTWVGIYRSLGSQIVSTDTVMLEEEGGALLLASGDESPGSLLGLF